MRTERRTFVNDAGDNLSAMVDLPVGAEPLGFALIAHCFTCSKNYKIMANISRFLETEYSAPKLLIGHSLGGTAMLAAAARIPSASAVVTLASPSHPMHVTEHFAAAQVQVAGRSYTLKKQFVEDLQAFSMDTAVRDLGKSLLVCHSPEDEVVDIANATRIYQAARHPKNFVSLNRADHMISEQADGLYVGALIAAWSRHCVGDRHSSGDRLCVGDQEIDNGTDLTPVDTRVGDHAHQVVVETGGDYQTEILAGGHQLTADEPVALGGGDSGPSPYDYLVAALGACTSITLRMYADRKGWPLEAVRVRLNHEKIHARDCASCETGQGRVDRIDREVELIGPLDQAQRQRLLEIASRCPVHRTLESEVIVDTCLFPPPPTAG